jgi:hypothetical protein
VTPDFRYSVVSTNVDGDSSTARFISPKSAYMWAQRLKDEGIPFVIKDQTKAYDVPIAELKKEAGPIRTATKGRKR